MQTMLRSLHHVAGGDEDNATPALIAIKISSIWIIWILGFTFGLLPFFV